MGALAIGALAIGRMAVRRLAVGKARIGSLEVGELKVCLNSATLRTIQPERPDVGRADLPAREP
jgi:hypothetical protein